MVNIRVGTPINLLGEVSIFVSFPFNNKLLGIIKTQPAREYHAESASWELPVARLMPLIEKLAEYEIQLTGPAMDKVVEVLPGGFEFKTTPFAHQLECFHYGLKRDKFVLGDEQGLGKTKQVIDLAVAEKPKHKHCLVISAVNGLKWTWHREVATHSNEKAYILGTRTKKSGKEYIGGNKDRLQDLVNLPDDYFLITNVETLRYSEKVKLKSGRSKTVYPIQDKLKELIDSGEIGMVVIDEIHKCKNPASQAGKAIMQLKANKRIALSGTPLMNNPLDLFIILNWLDFEEHSFYAFKQHYCILGGMGNEVVGYKNLQQLRDKLDSSMLRRLKKEVTDLPDKVHSTEYVEMLPKQAKIYNEVLESIRDNIDLIRLSPMPLAQLIRLRQATGYPGILSSTIHDSAKLDRMEELVADIVSQGHKAIIFSNWTDITTPALKRLSKYNPATITGETKDRVAEENKFMQDASCKVIVGTIGAMGTGLTLTAAQYVIFLDEPWNRALKDQAEDRAHRIGTTGTVNVITLVCEDTLDERINEIVMKKGSMADLLVDGKASPSVGLLLDYIKA